MLIAPILLVREKERTSGNSKRALLMVSKFIHFTFKYTQLFKYFRAHDDFLQVRHLH